MRFTATEEQAAQILANAYNASVPMGMGFLHFTPEPLEASAFIGKTTTYFDYASGRMMKFGLEREAGVNQWSTPSGTPSVSYQSWARTYPSYRSLVESVTDVRVSA